MKWHQQESSGSPLPVRPAILSPGFGYPGSAMLAATVTVEELKESTSREHAPVNLSPELSCLWYDFKGDWEQAHRIAQEIRTPIGSQIHAYLHRKEGDSGNARYWYSRAGEPECTASLEEEWDELAGRLLAPGEVSG